MERMSDYIHKEEMSKWLKQYGQDVLHGKYKFSLMYIWKNLMDLPPADVAPVRHGKWIDHDGNKIQLNEHGETCGTCFCSRCGEWLVASDEYAVKGYFCPNCGAKMDAQREE